MRAIYRYRFSDRAASDKAFCKSSTCGKQQRRIYVLLFCPFLISNAVFRIHILLKILLVTLEILKVLHFRFTTEASIKLIKKNARGIFLH